MLERPLSGIEDFLWSCGAHRVRAGGASTLHEFLLHTSSILRRWRQP